MHYYKFNISDWHLATSHLSLEEEAVYFKLINYYYDSEQPIPLETQSVCRRLRLGDYSALVQTVLHEFFIKSDDGWHHNRCDSELEKYHHKSEVNQKVGKLGGRPKKINDLESNPQTTQSVSKNNPQTTLTTNHKPITKNHIKTTPKVVTPEGVSDDLWNDFLIYRKRLKAPVSERVLARLIKEAELAKMPLDQVLETIIFKGWRSFEASWIQQAQQKSTELPLGTEQQIEEAYRVECGGDPRLARFNSYFEMKKFIQDQRDKRKKV
jgi:uncharacterized protein YdaU (DUF1376 family)